MQPWIRFSPNSLHCQSWTYALVPCPGFSLLNRYPSYKHCQRGFPTTKVLPPTCTDLPRPPPQHKPTHGTPHHSPARKRLKSFGLPDAPRPPPSRGASAPRTAEDSKGVPAGSWCLPAPGRTQLAEPVSKPQPDIPFLLCVWKKSSPFPSSSVSQCSLLCFPLVPLQRDPEALQS